MKNNSIKAIKEFIAELPAQLELQVAIAKLQRKKFLALMAEGFTEAQALELSKKITS